MCSRIEVDNLKVMSAISRLALGLGLIQLARSQTESIEGKSRCGHVVGDTGRAFECSLSSSCGLFSVFGRANAHIGCCGEGACAIPTTCIELGTTSNSHTLQCTGNVLPMCATYTWPEYKAEGYYCASYRTTDRVYRDPTTTELTITMTELPFPTLTLEPVDGPDLGTENDLNSRQRIGVGVGSGVSGSLLLVFFVIFGCCRRSRRDTNLTRPQAVYQAVESSM